MSSRLSIRLTRWFFELRRKRCFTERLPPELLHQIFIHCLESPSPSLREAPLNIGQVCRSWRKIVLGSPFLWSEIYICSFTSPDIPFLGHARLLEEWIKRSGECPLSLTILFKGSENPDPGLVTGVDTFIAKILPHVRRWKRIELFIPAPCRASFLQVLSTGAPRLEELSVLYNTNIASTSNPQLADVSLTPRLSNLTLPPDIRFLCTSAVTLHSVRVLHLSFTSLDDCFHCLDSCPSIVDINFILFSNDVDFSTCFGQRIRLLPNLQRMKVKGDSKMRSNPHRIYTNEPRNNIGLFLDCLRVPTLTSVEIIQPWITQVPGWNHLSSLLQRSQFHSPQSHSQSQVEELTISGSQMDDREFIQLLRYLPHLKHIIVDECHVTEFTLDTIATRLDTPISMDSTGSAKNETENCYWLCPKLRRIGIREDVTEKTYGISVHPATHQRNFVLESYCVFGSEAQRPAQW